MSTHDIRFPWLRWLVIAATIQAVAVLIDTTVQHGPAGTLGFLGLTAFGVAAVETAYALGTAVGRFLDHRVKSRGSAR